MTIESPEANNLFQVPWEYSDLAQVFSPRRGPQLPPHHNWDCTIMLKEGAAPPHCKIYPLSQEEERIMGQYIKEALQQGYIHPSTSPALASVLFVKKKAGGLRPCVDYQGLNEVLKCGRSKIPHTPPAGNLMPLPSSLCPWLHIAIDFVTGLPISEKNTVILVITDRFSKMFGLPEDIVLDQDTQFTSRVWRELLGKLNIMVSLTVSLTSGYQPQANGQVERINQELGNSKASWTFHVSALDPVVEGSLAEEGRPPGPPPRPIDIEGAPAYR
ncbi:hypothetical protein P4O66_011819, partial [Electrophorus voltai]